MADPSFLEHMRGQLRRQLPPVSPPKSSSLVKKQKSYFKKAFSFSLVLHGTLLFLFVVIPFVMSLFGLEKDYSDRFQKKEFRNAIRVDVVGLPTRTLQELQKIDPTQEIKKDSAPKAAPEAPAPSETAMKMLDQKAPVPAKPAASTRKAEQERLERLRASLRVEQRRQELARQLNDEDSQGRAALAGNLLSEGYSVTGDVAQDMDVYQGHLKAHLRKTWNLPGWMEASSLSARVLVKLGPNGRIISHSFLRKSSNEEFDRYVLQAIKDAEPFPQPPPTLQRIVLEDGIEWGFPQ